MDQHKYVRTLLDASAAIELPCDEALARRVAAHHALVDKWARRINLTTVLDPEAAAIRHGLDCLLFSTLLPAEAPVPTLDVGSGGGFPGLVLAIAQPERPMILLEPIRKRASFLRTAAAQLGLRRVRVVEGRLEAGRPARGIEWPVPAVVSRATIPPLELVPLLGEYLAPGGQAVLTAGQGAPELTALVAAAEAAGLSHDARHTFTLPGGLTRILDRLRAAPPED